MTNISLGKIAGSAAILNNGKILLLKRSPKEDTYPNHWTFPSGGRENQDGSIEETAIREVKEETGMDFIVEKKFNFYDLILNNKHVFSLVHIGGVTGEIQLQPDEAIDYGWFTYKEAKQLSLAFVYEQVIDDLHKEGRL
jgi:ADP-ribose pyrophosphatase YjhB (NUDIX family)